MNLQVLPFKVAYQALGLIDKLVNGPLWRMMAKEKEVLSMSTHYQILNFLNKVLIMQLHF